MFSYNKLLEYPIKIKNPNPRLANIVITQYGGPNGELGASLRYLSQRYTMPDDTTKGLLTDIGTYYPKYASHPQKNQVTPFKRTSILDLSYTMIRSNTSFVIWSLNSSKYTSLLTTEHISSISLSLFSSAAFFSRSVTISSFSLSISF